MPLWLTTNRHIAQDTKSLSGKTKIIENRIARVSLVFLYAAVYHTSGISRRTPRPDFFSRFPGQV